MTLHCAIDLDQSEIRPQLYLVQLEYNDDDITERATNEHSEVTSPPGVVEKRVPPGVEEYLSGISFESLMMTRRNAGMGFVPDSLVAIGDSIGAKQKCRCL